METTPVYANGTVIGYIVRLETGGSFYVQRRTIPREQIGWARCSGLNAPYLYAWEHTQDRAAL